MTATMSVSVQTTIAPSVFVVDDEPEMRMLARVFLERGGFNVVDEAEDGSQALERFQELNPPPVPSVVLLDNRMPGLTGLEVAEQMLARHPSQVIVLFSAHLDSAVKDKARAIGITACVSKMEASRLSEIIRGLLPQQ
jgi:two-component system, chemotaxis family, chemotaxis protein CheY